ncbi:MAG TPA: cation diffusion facilitator family transporter [Miltoncostaeaceae bacterium]|nr:cation diffusion facilitator family transporter [Miltoncostaeaceae bacterium]
MGHGHEHAHGGTPKASRTALQVALVANAAYTALQAVVGFAVGSVALLADAGHNLSDVLALAVALGAAALAARPATPRHSFGFRRAEVLAALANALSIVAVAAIVAVEAIRRLDDPPEVPGAPLALVALGGIVVNLGSAVLIHRAQGGHGDLNLRASFLHLAGDAAASLGVLVGGVLVIAFGWDLADPLIALGIAALIALSTWGVLRDAVLVLLESAPRGIDPEQVGAALAECEGVVDVHDLHVWEITPGFPALAAHVIVEADSDARQVRRELQRILDVRFQILHTTLQVENQPRRRLMPERPHR